MAKKTCMGVGKFLAQVFRLQSTWRGHSERLVAEVNTTGDCWPMLWKCHCSR